MNIVIDADLAKTLREAALAKYGKMRGASLLVEEALRQYFHNEGIEVKKSMKTESKENPCKAASLPVSVHVGA